MVPLYHFERAMSRGIFSADSIFDPMPYSKAFKEAHPDVIKSRQALANAKFRAAHPGVIQAAQKDWYKRNRERQLERRAQQRVKKPLQDAESYLKREYGLTFEDYTRMLEAQGGVCAICKGPPSGRWKHRFHIDHDHKTDRVRGLLCFHCNAMLGNARDQASILSAAVTYLRERS